MPKKILQLPDFSGGVNGVADPQNIANNELAECHGFKADIGVSYPLGDMKSEYGDSSKIGSELIDVDAVDNSTFDNDQGAWVVYGSTIAWHGADYGASGGGIRITPPDPLVQHGAQLPLTQVGALDTNATHRVSVSLKGTAGSLDYFGVKLGGGWGGWQSITTDHETYYFDIVPANDSDALIIQHAPSGGTGVWYIDTVSVKVITAIGSAATQNRDIDPGYGIFTFSHDYNKSAVLTDTNYLVYQQFSSSSKGVTNVDIYDYGGAWVHGKLNLGAESAHTIADTSIVGEIKPCFTFIDGVLRVSPGEFGSTETGSSSSYGMGAEDGIGAITTIATANDDVGLAHGDLLVRDGVECIFIGPNGSDAVFMRNVTGSFTGTHSAGNFYFMPDTRWRGVVVKKYFSALTTRGSITSWINSYAHPRPPVAHLGSLSPSGDNAYPFAVLATNGAVTLTPGYSPHISIGWLDTEANADGVWDSTKVEFYITALYDDARQESQPFLTVNANSGTAASLVAGEELGMWIGVEYADTGVAKVIDGTSVNNAYQMNPRVVGARVYYEDAINEPGILYQLLEIDFEKGCKKVSAEQYEPWAEVAADETCGCPHDGSGDHGFTASERTTANGNAFIFTAPPKLFTYEINTGYEANVSTYARYKTATVANRRLYIGNVWQNGKAHGDRMMRSVYNKFDLFPENNTIDVAIGDGDNIVKLETFADRILQFKKRTLYIINIAGEAFLESQHANMGVENPSQTCVTEFGIAWVNTFGVYLYDGQGVTEISRGKLRQADRSTAASYSYSLNITESDIPLIGYHPVNKWIIIHRQSTIEGYVEGTALIYDFKNGSWTHSGGFTANSDYKTNMIWTHDNNLVLAGGTNSDEPDFFYYNPQGVDTGSSDLVLTSKDFTLDAPGVKKNVYGIFVTFSADASTAILAEIIYKTASGETTVATTSASALYHDSNGFQSTDDVKATIELTPASAISNASSFQVKIKSSAAYNATDNFRLYNISFRYRTKGVH